MKKYLLDEDGSLYVLDEQIPKVVGNKLRIGSILEVPVLKFNNSNIPWILENLLYSYRNTSKLLEKWKSGEMAFLGYPKKEIFKAKIILPYNLKGSLIDILSSESLVYLRFCLDSFPPTLQKSYPLCVYRESNLGNVKDKYFVLEIISKENI